MRIDMEDDVQKLTEEQKTMIREDRADELCSCGHRKSEHNDTLARGHGSCKVCGCRKFTWVKFIFD